MPYSSKRFTQINALHFRVASQRFRTAGAKMRPLLMMYARSVTESVFAHRLWSVTRMPMPERFQVENNALHFQQP